MRIYLIFDLININDKYSPWDQDQIVIKLGTQLIIHQKLANFFYKKDIHVNRLESVIFGIFVSYRTKQNAKGNWILEVLKYKNELYQLIELEEQMKKIGSFF